MKDNVFHRQEIIQVLKDRGMLRKLDCLKGTINCDDCGYRAHNYCCLLKGLSTGYLMIKRAVR